MAKRKLIESVHINQIDLIAAIGKHLDRRHKIKNVLPRQYNAIIAAANLIVAEFAEAERPSRDGMGLQAWLLSDDTGISSKYIVSAIKRGESFRSLGGKGVGYGHPHDSDDFGRCVRLLKAAPELRSQLSVMRECSKEWKQLFDNWADLEALYEGEEYRKCSERIRELMKQVDSH